jgi:hypothetical protein
MIGARGGFTTAKNMTAAQRKARARKAAKASATVRSAAGGEKKAQETG